MMNTQTEPAQATIREKMVSVMIWILGSLYFVTVIPLATLLMILFKPRTYDKTVKALS